jgi:hypothetical protein
MAGYSGTPLPKKLGIKPGHSVALLDAPPGFEQTALAAEMPSDVTVQHDTKGKRPLDVVVLFVAARKTLEKRFDAVTARIETAGALWVAWPKKSSGVETDMTEDFVRTVALPKGWVDNKVCAIDETWSGLRVVRRRENR